MLLMNLVFFAVFLVIVDRVAREGVLGQSTPPILWAGMGVMLLVMFVVMYVIGKRL
jgi:hypothetical protein